MTWCLVSLFWSSPLVFICWHPFFLFTNIYIYLRKGFESPLHVTMILIYSLNLPSSGPLRQIPMDVFTNLVCFRILLIHSQSTTQWQQNIIDDDVFVGVNQWCHSWLFLPFYITLWGLTSHYIFTFTVQTWPFI